MRINDNMKIRKVLNENIVIMPGQETTDMTKVIALNGSALDLYEALKGKDFEIEDAVRVLTDGYEIDEATARKDVEAWLAEMQANGLMQ